MRALSVKQPWAELIARGLKKVENRTWARDFRGDLLIVASKGRNDEEVIDAGLDPEVLVYGAAVCVVNLTKVTGDDGDYKWHLSDPRRVKPFPVKGYASIYHVEDAQIQVLSAGKEANHNNGKESKSPSKKLTGTARKPTIAAGSTILVIHDQRSRLHAIAKHVELELGIEPGLALGTKQGYEYAELTLPEIVIVPEIAQDMSGIEFAQKVHRTVWGKPIKVLILGNLTSPPFSAGVSVAVPARANQAQLGKALRKLLEA
jgi:ASCH domain